MPTHQPAAKVSPKSSVAASEHGSLSSKTRIDDGTPRNLSHAATPALASRETESMDAALGDAILRFLRIRKGPKGKGYDLDTVSPISTWLYRQ
jgi:hypothetical protein